jgi:hypothetical protein
VVESRAAVFCRASRFCRTPADRVTSLLIAHILDCDGHGAGVANDERE